MLKSKMHFWKKGALAFAVIAAVVSLRGSVAFAADVAIDEENFPDEIFRNYVSENFDKDKNGILDEDEINRVYKIDCSGNYSSGESGGIRSLKGVEFFTNLNYLKCSNNELTELDVSKNIHLSTLFFDDNQLTEIDVSHNTELYFLGFYRNQVTSIDVSNNVKLNYLWFLCNKVSSLDLSNNVNLKSIVCYKNELKELDVSKNTQLEELWCGMNYLTSLDISNNPNLTELRCGQNQISELDVSGNKYLNAAALRGEKTEMYCAPREGVVSDHVFGYRYNNYNLEVDPTVKLITKDLLFGDCNDDDKVNRADRIYLARALANWEGYTIPDVTVADFTNDGQVNRADRIYLARALANWEGYSVE